ncbi:MAG TPA: YebC/PmpR family DNA-binding transcriptional regulator [Candidatus Babeliales bacterium]|nr:YebC/PmpR family DNA-binding transcriptional regulator [Candidatus Babeliales bacterium]
MAGHSKWANIKHKKAKEDSKRGKAFTKLTKEITVCAREGGGDPAGNARLRLLMEKAREINMPLENTMRAIKKGTGELPGAQYESHTYEGYAPHGIAVMVDTLFDNKNRIAADMRRLFSRHGGSLGESGSVNWMFEQRGVIRATGSNMTEDELLEKLLDYPIEDISKDEQLFSIQCDSKSVDKVRQAVISAGLKVEEAELEWIAKSTISLPEEQAQKVYDFLTELDDHEDVQNVYTNLE